MSAQEALAKAEEAELDLVKISPNATPPVCKLMDYGKYRSFAARVSSSTTLRLSFGIS